MISSGCVHRNRRCCDHVLCLWERVCQLRRYRNVCFALFAIERCVRYCQCRSAMCCFVLENKAVLNVCCASLDTYMKLYIILLIFFMLNRVFAEQHSMKCFVFRQISLVVSGKAWG